MLKHLGLGLSLFGLCLLHLPLLIISANEQPWLGTPCYRNDTDAADVLLLLLIVAVPLGLLCLAWGVRKLMQHSRSGWLLIIIPVLLLAVDVYKWQGLQAYYHCVENLSQQLK